MKRILKIFAIILSLTSLCQGTFAQSSDSLRHHNTPRWKSHLRATSLTTGVNVFLWSFDRYVTNSKFARINIKTVKSNIETGFVWDSDRLATNHLGHPFNGGFYFAGARCNQMNYWQSTAYSAFGSLVWEVCAENEPPGLNDFIATPLAGAAFGEVFHRVSDKILDDRKSGWNRVLREAGSAVVNPVRFVDRLFKGDLWWVNHDPFATDESDFVDFNFSVGVGARYLSDSKNAREGSTYPLISLNLEYGDPFQMNGSHPFDYFNAHASIHPGSSNTQPLFGRVNITGRLWGSEIDTDDDQEALWGIFQQYDFYHNRHAKGGSVNDLFNFSETAAFGAGLMLYQHGKKGVEYRQSLFADVILLGAAENKNLFIIERHYNMGSGFALKSQSSLMLPFGLRISLDAKLFWLRTWKEKNYRLIDESVAPLYYDTAGDQGSSWAFVLEPSLDYSLTGHTGLFLSASRLGLSTEYKNHDSQTARTTEICLGVRYKF